MPEMRKTFGAACTRQLFADICHIDPERPPPAPGLKEPAPGVKRND
ncbi:hypothetical protein ASZ90_015214 [hydrocarbon metagenome]|uniref:Uncharacterized protein n=1 Tax=hydrocarbon metagenome TaxID=938273 RepID=A0A0W8F2L6_9ZZZZ